jgi:hypothetical protein
VLELEGKKGGRGGGDLLPLCTRPESKVLHAYGPLYITNKRVTGVITLYKRAPAVRALRPGNCAVYMREGGAPEAGITR